MNEDMQKICDALAATLRKTDHFRYEGLDHLEYNADRQLVYAYFRNGRQKIIDVTADSGVTMIADIFAQLTYK